MRSLGLSLEDLTPCDMSVCGANNSNIKVLGALLIEFSTGAKPGDPSTKQIVYICDGVVGALLSLEACIDLKLVEEQFPHACVSTVEENIGESSAQQEGSKKSKCSCKCSIRKKAPDAPTEMPMDPTVQNVPRLQQWILFFLFQRTFLIFVDGLV